MTNVIRIFSGIHDLLNYGIDQSICLLFRTYRNKTQNTDNYFTVFHLITEAMFDVVQSTG